MMMMTMLMVLMMIVMMKASTAQRAALVGPSWAILDALTTRGPGIQTPGEGRRGRWGLDEGAR